MSETIQIRVFGADGLPVLVYLPGVHGDWTLVGGFRRALGAKVRFAEVTYPRTLDWSLDDYAAATEQALAEHGMNQGWLLGESFSSQVVWQILARKRFQTEGVILAGGFVRHPMPWGARLAAWVCASFPVWLIGSVMAVYARTARWRFRRSPETVKEIREFVSRRNEPDRAAMVHRLRLIAGNDPRPIAREALVPVCGLSGFLDPVVPWFWVRSWLRRQCPSLRDFRIVGSADHNVLGTAPETSAREVLRWMKAI